MLQTLIGALIGIAATVVVGRYYYRRSLKKSLGVYTLLDSRVFSGIQPDVRAELHFVYRNRERLRRLSIVDEPPWRTE